MKLGFCAAGVVALTVSTTAAAVPDRLPHASNSLRVTQAATSCSAGKSICDGRGPGCGAKFSQCMTSNCLTEGPAYGGATHGGLATR